MGKITETFKDCTGNIKEQGHVTGIKTTKDI
jgi:hypothetical protein